METKPTIINPVNLKEQDDVWLEMFSHASGAYYVMPCIVKWIEQDGMCVVGKDDKGGHYCAFKDFNIGHKKATFGWRCWDSEPTPEQREAVPWIV